MNISNCVVSEGEPEPCHPKRGRLPTPKTVRAGPHPASRRQEGTNQSRGVEDFNRAWMTDGGRKPPIMRRLDVEGLHQRLQKQLF